MIMRNNNFGNSINNRIKVTPNRERSQNCKRQMHPINFRSNDNNPRNLSPNKLNATKKPFADVMSPKRNTFDRNYSNPRLEYGINYNFGFCSRHPQKCAQFLTKISGQGTLYCEKCAIQLASKGIQILRFNGSQNENKIQNKKIKAKDSLKRQKYDGIKQFQEVKKFIQTINISEQRHKNQKNKLESMQKHYKNQLKITQKFYNQLIQILVQMKQDHMQDLIKQGQQHCQIAQLQNKNLSQNLQQIYLFKNDIQSQIDFILDQFKQNKQKFQQIISFYREKTETFSNKNNQIDQLFQNIIDYKSKDLTKQIKDIENYIMQSWQSVRSSQNIKVIEKVNEKIQPNFIKNEVNVGNYLKTSNNNESNKKIVNILNFNSQKNETNYKGKNFCRKLFNDDDENFVYGEKSPEFKNI